MKLAFGYKAGSGKDTCLQLLYDLYDNINVIRFSEPLYTITKHIQTSFNIQPHKDRALLQQSATFLRNFYGNDIFVKIAEEKINNNANNICPDLRHKVEAEMLRKNGFVLIKLNRDNIDPNIINGDDRNHISEHDLDDFQFDAIIDNNGNVDDLKDQLIKIISSI